MENNMMCKGCDKPETQCTCENCPCRGGACNTCGKTSGRCCNMSVCPCGHHKIMPLLIILFGIIFLLSSLSVMSMAMAYVLGSVIVILAGLAKLFGGSCKCYVNHC